MSSAPDTARSSLQNGWFSYAAAVPWPSERSIDGGLDAVPVEDVPGLLWLCGKHLVGRDPEAALERIGDPGVIVCLNERHELIDRYPGYVRWLTDEAGRRALWFPIPDLHAPDLDEAAELAGQIAARLRAGEHVIVQCGAGIGRAGTIAILTLMVLGHSAEDAATAVGQARPMAGPEAGAQRDLIESFAHRLSSTPPSASGRIPGPPHSPRR